MAEIDREKTIEGLKRYLNYPKPLCDVAQQAITLLKEQEAIKPVISRSGQYFCGGCRGYLCSTGKESGVRYCNYCGRSVKWNE